PSYTISLEVLSTADHKRRELKGQPAGACTLLPKEAVRLVYPIPDGLRLWFGDEYMYGKLKSEGWKIVQGEFNAYHYGSLSIASNPESNEVIAQDKLNWAAMR
ncbi:MAG: hypothetical protein NUV80_03760, partial [Candidatus Berkelbacteria bacterium]|nr:hypothetical protein [Candidatus Berkelbacteria bacterium]